MGKEEKVISLVLLVGIYVVVFGVALIFLSFRARNRSQASLSEVRLRQPGAPVRRQQHPTRR